MRLLKTDTVELVDIPYDTNPDYAILSHRWGAEEISLQELQQGTGKNKQGFKKVQQSCDRARADGYNYIWIDTCCIDKTSSTELSEAINSMFAWYYQASRCYAHLADVPMKCAVKDSEWFSRGWTLQELLAPEEVYFVDANWVDLGTKETLQQDIHDATGIPLEILSGTVEFETASVAERMSWAAKRKTTRVEDGAYSLLGLFGIHMPLLYGEGERAFIRLQEEIMKITSDHSIFAWASDDMRGGVLATSPAAFASSNLVRQYSSSSTGNDAIITISSRGIELEAQIIGHGPGGICLVILDCTQPSSNTKWPRERVGIWLRDKYLTMATFERVQSQTLQSVDLSQYSTAQRPVRRICIETGRIKPLRKPTLRLSNTNNTTPTGNTITNTTTNLTATSAFQIFDTTFLRSLPDTLGSAPLVQAAQQGQTDNVCLLLTRSDIDINQQDQVLGLTAISDASQNGHIDTVKLLLARGADLLARDKLGRTALHHAAMRGQRHVIELLTSIESIFIDQLDDTGCTPLLLAIQQRHGSAVASVLLAQGSNRHAEDQSGRTALLLAVENGDESLVSTLLDSDDETDNKKLIDEPNRSGHSPLRIAASKGYTGILELLLSRGADASICDSSGYTVLHWAAEDDNSAVIQILLTKSSTVDIHLPVANENHQTALHLACISGQHIIVTQLLKHGANVQAKDKYEWTPLFYAAAGLHDTIVGDLLEYGADIEACGEDGVTPLLYAFNFSARRMAKLLITLGARFKATTTNSVVKQIQQGAQHEYSSILEDLKRQNMIDNDDDKSRRVAQINKLPLRRVIHHSQHSIIHLLLDAGVDLNKKNEAGHTQLSEAVSRGDLATVKILLNAGADLEITSGWGGTTVLFKAVRLSHHDIVQALLDGGANAEFQGLSMGWTPLCEAVFQNNVRLINRLLDAGADINGGNGATPLHLAFNKGNVLAAEVLFTRGAKLGLDPETVGINKEASKELMALFERFE